MARPVVKATKMMATMTNSFIWPGAAGSVLGFSVCGTELGSRLSSVVLSVTGCVEVASLVVGSVSSSIEAGGQFGTVQVLMSSMSRSNVHLAQRS